MVFVSVFICLLTLVVILAEGSAHRSFVDLTLSRCFMLLSFALVPVVLVADCCCCDKSLLFRGRGVEVL